MGSPDAPQSTPVTPTPDPERVAALDALYAELPHLECRGLCWHSCGPIDMSHTERDRIAELLAAHPLVTIVGTAGCGKTRLSIEAARAAAGEFPDGVWAVDLTAAEGGDQVLPTIASAVGLAVPTAGTTADALRAE